MADLVCSVYYDSFAKTVASISSSSAANMFSRNQFIGEFKVSRKMKITNY